MIIEISELDLQGIVLGSQISNLVVVVGNVGFTLCNAGFDCSLPISKLFQFGLESVDFVDDVAQFQFVVIHCIPLIV